MAIANSLSIGALTKIALDIFFPHKRCPFGGEAFPQSDLSFVICERLFAKPTVKEF